MSLHRTLIGFVPLLLCAADPGLETALKSVENRYNKAKTLQVQFREDYTPPGRPRRSESGTLLLSKPGKMRWDYSDPKGKLFISDGKYLWLYVPSDNRAEKMKLKESEDMRAPLAFLLGKLNFDKEFRNLHGTAENGGWRVVAEPKTDSLPYSRVEFAIAPDNRIRQVKVTGFDKSVLDFTFDAEQVNPRLDAQRFKFEAPAGAQIVEAAQ